MGVDWNEKHGAEIVILGQDRINGRLTLVEALLVPKAEFTQLAGVQKVIDLNKKWKPDYIYSDNGNGSTNNELLAKTASDIRRYGGDRDTARIVDILRAYDSGASIVVKDPVFNEEKKVPAKPFMVNASIRMFEQGIISISSSDKILEAQLRNYIIVRYSPTKTPVYGLENPKVEDHRLDALNLAIVAFHLNFNKLYEKIISTTVGTALDPRMIGSSSERGLEGKGESFPEERRLATSKLSLSYAPGRINEETIRTDRVGWDTDQEERKKMEWLQRRYSRRKMQREDVRPKRTNI